MRWLPGVFLLVLAGSEVAAQTGIAPGPLTLLRSMISPTDRFLTASLLGAFVLHVWHRPPRREVVITIVLALVLEAARGTVELAYGQGVGVVIGSLGVGFGLASLVVLAIGAVRRRDVDPERTVTVLLSAAVMPAVVIASPFFVSLTAALHPLVLDGFLYAFDATLGTQLSFMLGRLFETWPPLQLVSYLTYTAVPLVFAVVFAAQSTRRARPPIDLLAAFLTATIAGSVLHHLFPVVGPVYVFGRAYPAGMPAGDNIPLAPFVAPPGLRNCMPSLHMAWALLLWWHARGSPAPVRVVAVLSLALTLLATLGLGLHYAIDLVVAVPFALAVQAACARQLPLTAQARQLALGGGVLLTAAWLVLLRYAVPLFQGVPGLSWVLIALTVGAALALESRLAAAAAVASPMSTPPLTETAGPSLTRRWLLPCVVGVFFLSGFASLIYEVAFAKSLALTFGSTATASTTVLATYMGGMALGAWLGGLVATRRPDPVRVYALCEAGIAGYCAASPWLLRWLPDLYVVAAMGAAADHPMLAVLQVALGGLVLLPPTVLMGATLPLLTRSLVEEEGSVGHSVAMLYGANTLGAALSAVTTGYVLLPGFGVTRTTWIAAAANLGAALVGLAIARRLADSGRSRPVGESCGARVASADASRDRALRTLGLTLLTVGGAVTVALEVTHVHLLAVVAGNSAYAFSLMLFCFLLGLGVGSAAGRWCLAHVGRPLVLLAWCELGLAATLLAGVFVWGGIPDYFAAFADYPLTRTFGAREFVRFAVCAVAMVPVAVWIGILYPIALDCAGRNGRLGDMSAVGRGIALNTAGNVVGALAGGFVLLPRLGSLRTLQLLAAIVLFLGLLPALRLSGWGRRMALAPAALVVALFLVQPASFDYTRLASGANVYFTGQQYGAVIDHAESLDGGLTTVAESTDPRGRRILTLLTNGKFQGDDGLDREMKAQYGFALVPLLHTEARHRALVIGFGVGGSARAISDAGFEQVDVADLSADIIALARRHFSSVNAGVLDRPGVHTYVSDGRNVLLLSRWTYDLISLEVSSIWFAGAASLYNREFYALAAHRLAPEGVLQQWLQLHRLSSADLVSVLGTVRTEFPFVWLYFVGNQGVIVACRHDCLPSEATLARLDARRSVQQPLALFGGSASALLPSRLLTPDGVDRFLSAATEFGLDAGALVSTDDNLLLEYSTPRGNVRGYEESLHENVNLLRRFSPPSALDGTRLARAGPAPRFKRGATHERRP